MESTNQTSVDKFNLLSLTNIPSLQVLFILIFLNVYILTLCGNSLLIVVVRINSRLQTPMYFFLSNLSVIDIFISSSIVPKMLINIIAQDKSISRVGCAMQMYFHLSLGATECVILAVMAVDRYAAICTPLQYNTIMNNNVCVCLAVASWSFCFITSSIHVTFIFQLPFCRSHQVNHFFCEMPSFFHLSCRDTFINELLMQISGALVAMCSFIFTVISYVHIISAILKIQSTEGRIKVFSTCSSHLIVVSLYYGTIIFRYMRPQTVYYSETDRIASIIYTAVTPMLNPIIYSIRNKDVKSTIRQKLCRTISEKN